MSDNREKAKKKEVVIIIAILLISMLFLAVFYIKNSLSDDINTANIYVYGELYDSVKLVEGQKQKTIKINAKLNVEIIFSGKEIYFYKSECPDKVCINAGRLKYKYESAACLPADVSIVID